MEHLGSEIGLKCMNSNSEYLVQKKNTCRFLNVGIRQNDMQTMIYSRPGTRLLWCWNTDGDDEMENHCLMYWWKTVEHSVNVHPHKSHADSLFINTRSKSKSSLVCMQHDHKLCRASITIYCSFLFLFFFSSSILYFSSEVEGCRVQNVLSHA